MSARESEAARIFLEAVEHYEYGQRADFVRQAAAGDVILWQRVDALLKAHGEANSLLDGDRLEPTRDIPEPSERTGTGMGDCAQPPLWAASTPARPPSVTAA